MMSPFSSLVRGDSLISRNPLDIFLYELTAGWYNEKTNPVFISFYDFRLIVLFLSPYGTRELTNQVSINFSINHCSTALCFVLFYFNLFCFFFIVTDSVAATNVNSNSI